MNRKIVMLVVSTLALGGCGGDGGGDGVIGTGNSPIVVAGAAQKGPFVLGSRITIERLTANGKPTGDTTFTTTNSDIGSFTFDLLEPGLVQIFADGYHFDEISGALSKGPITLRAMLDATGDTVPLAYVNVLTHIAYNRQMRLIQTGTASTETLRQAQSELVDALLPILPSGNFPQFTDMSLYNAPQTSPAANAYLVALSAVAYQYATEKALNNKSSVDAELTLLLNSFADDFGHDGSIDNSSLIGDLVAASRRIDPDSVRANLKLRAQQAGQNDLGVPDLNLFIDTDGDGIVNAGDSDDDNDGLPDDVDPHPYVKDVVTSNFANLSGVTSVGSLTELQASVSYPQLVVKLEYLVNGVSIGEATNPPYSITWNPYFWGDEGTVQVSIRTTDITGSVTESEPQAIQVSPNADLLLMTTPSSGSVIRDTAHPIVKWSMAGSTHHFSVQLWASASTSNLIVNETISATEFASPKLEPGSYFWRVRATNDQGNDGPWSANQQIIIAGPVPPTVLSPLANSLYRNVNQVDLTWAPSPFSVFHEVQLTNVTTTSTVVFENTTTDNIMTSTPLDAGTYEWRVRSANADAIWGNWSDSRKFILTGPKAPDLLSPDTTQPLPASQSVTFEWTNSEYALNYEFQTSKLEDFSQILTTTTTNMTSASLTNETGVYYLRLRSQNKQQFWGEWGQPIQFANGVFTRSFYSSGYTVGSRVIPTVDGGFAVVGHIEDITFSGRSAALLLKLDHEGNVTWKKTFDTPNYDLGLNIIQSSDGGYLISARAYTNGTSFFLLVKTDDIGNEQWSKSINDNGTTPALLQETTDGFLVGNTEIQATRPDNTTDYAPVLRKFDKTGSELWSYKLADSNVDFESLRLIADESGEYVLVGDYLPNVAGQTSILNLQSFKARLSHDRLQFSYTKLQAPPTPSRSTRLVNGDLCLVSVFMLNPWVTRFDSNNVVLWSTTVYEPSDFSGMDQAVSETKSGKIVVGGGYSAAIGVSLFDGNGQRAWTRKYGNLNFSDMIATIDNGLLILGHRTNNSRTEIVVIKTDPSGATFRLEQPISTGLTSK